MNILLISFVVAILLSAITVFADFLVKHASLQKGFSGWHMLLIGSIIYALTALVWFFLMRKIKLSTLGVVYGLSCIIFLTLLSVFYFKEKINSIEIFGIILAIISFIILFRFA